MTAIVLPLSFPNFSEVSYYNETEINTTNFLGSPPPVPPNDFAPPGDRVPFWNTPSPDRTNTVLPGAINPSFATAAADLNATNVTPGGTASTTTTIKLSLPSKSTVLGGVISTPHTADNDFAGIFADDTSGVFVGVLPKSS